MDTHTSDQSLGSGDALVGLYRTVTRIRLFEEQVITLFRDGSVQGFSHSYIGQEAVAAGACAPLRREDRITSTHRGHGHVIAKGGDTTRMLAEILGRSTGYCKGKSGELHIMDASLGILGANGIVGGGFPIAVGAALADKLANRDLVTVCFFGEGAAGEGTFAESLNLAAIWSLPVLFVCENNLYGEFTAAADVCAGTIHERASGYGIPGVQIDGQSVTAVRDAVEAAVSRARAGGGPTLIEAMTYRREGHVYGEEALLGSYRYRDEAEVARWNERDPVANARRICQDSGVDAADLDRIDAEAGEEMRLAAKAALAAPFPDQAEALDDVFVEAI
jgi:TPP-dependent pyruvate/acetoin dehydrogenase alpha subunit